MNEATPSTKSDMLKALLNRTENEQDDYIPDTVNLSVTCKSGNCPQCGVFHRCLDCIGVCQCGYFLR